MVLQPAASHAQALPACLANLPSNWGRCRHDLVSKHVYQPLPHQGPRASHALPEPHVASDSRPAYLPQPVLQARVPQTPETPEESLPQVLPREALIFL